MVMGVPTQLSKLIYKYKLEDKLCIPCCQRTDEYKIILSVGELNQNKNHASAIRALAQMRDKKWRYYICGKGKLYQSLQNLIQNLNLSNRVYLLGYQTNVADLYRCADLFLFPSFREGLSVSLMEAIAARVPVACSQIRGNVDLVEDGLFDPHSIKDIQSIVEKMLYCYSKEKIATIVERNSKNIEKFSIRTVEKKAYQIYKIFLDNSEIPVI